MQEEARRGPAASCRRMAARGAVGSVARGGGGPAQARGPPRPARGRILAPLLRSDAPLKVLGERRQGRRKGLAIKVLAAVKAEVSRAAARRIAELANYQQETHHAHHAVGKAAPAGALPRKKAANGSRLKLAVRRFRHLVSQRSRSRLALLRGSGGESCHSCCCRARWQGCSGRSWRDSRCSAEASQVRIWLQRCPWPTPPALSAGRHARQPQVRADAATDFGALAAAMLQQSPLRQRHRLVVAADESHRDAGTSALSPMRPACRPHAAASRRW
jgi:hypothetical protein